MNGTLNFEKITIWGSRHALSGLGMSQTMGPDLGPCAGISFISGVGCVFSTPVFIQNHVKMVLLTLMEEKARGSLNIGCAVMRT